MGQGRLFGYLMLKKQGSAAVQKKPGYRATDVRIVGGGDGHDSVKRVRAE